MQGQIACFFTGNCHQFNYIAGVLLETIPARNAAVCLFSYCNIIDAECFKKLSSCSNGCLRFIFVVLVVVVVEIYFFTSDHQTFHTIF